MQTDYTPNTKIDLEVARDRFADPRFFARTDVPAMLYGMTEYDTRRRLREAAEKVFGIAPSIFALVNLGYDAFHVALNEAIRDA